MQKWITRHDVVLLVITTSIATTYIAARIFRRFWHHTKSLERKVEHLYDAVEAISREIDTLSDRITALEIHTRSNTTALRAFNTSTRLNLHRCAKTIERLQGQRTSIDDLFAMNENRQVLPLVKANRRIKRAGPECSSPSRRLESRFKELCRNWTVDEAAIKTLEEFQQTELDASSVLGPAELRIEALISLQKASKNK